MIAAADVIVFVVSPDSVRSNVCDEEIAFARSLAKRVIPVLCRHIDCRLAPPRLAALNVKVSFADSHDFQEPFAALTKALDRDVTWLREQTRLTIAATEWERSNGREDLLLRGSVIGDAEAWSARRPPTAPEVSELVLRFLSQSRSAQTDRENADRQALDRQRRLQRRVTRLIVVAFLIAMAGGWWVLRGQQNLSRSQSRFLANEARAEFEAGNYDRAIRLSIIAARDTWRTPSANEAAFELGRAAEYARTSFYLPPDLRRMGCVSIFPDGRDGCKVDYRSFRQGAPPSGRAAAVRWRRSARTAS